MEISKIAGIILLVIGVLLIVVPLLQTYSILTGKGMPPQVFKNPESVKIDKNVTVADIQGQVQNAMTKIFPFEAINSILNLATWLVLMWILMYGGGKIADIGVKLLNSNHG